MILGKKIVVVMPAYNAEKTLQQTVETLMKCSEDSMGKAQVDEVILVDDCSPDQTKQVAKDLGLKTIVHTQNLGYGGNQKTCYQAALQSGADIVVMLHPDYQYSPELVSPMAHMIASGLNDCVLGSRILGGGALKGGMPLYKYFFNRCLTAGQNLLMGQKVSEYHTGLRAFSKEVIEKLPLGECDDDFVFDNEMLAQVLYFGFRIGEVSCPAKYFPEASSINFSRSVKYGLGVIRVSLTYFFSKLGLVRSRLFIGTKKILDVAPRGSLFHGPN
jgi:glycosyltransferase involved in cell wall biosynthesis